MVSGRIVGGKSVNFLQNSCESVPLQTCHPYIFSFLMFITDPNSLTCDQWVLLKKRRPKRVTNITG